MDKLMVAFVELGYKLEHKRLKGTGMSSEDRLYLSTLHKQANDLEMSFQMRNACIVEGELKARMEFYGSRKYN